MLHLGKLMKHGEQTLSGKFCIGGTAIEAPIVTLSRQLLEHHFPDNESTTLVKLEGHNQEPQFTMEELMEVLNNLPKKKSPGKVWDSQWRWLKIHSLHEPLLNVFNECLEFEYFPDCWKGAVVKMIPKPDKNDYSDPKSYRPIGLLAVVSKDLEKIAQSKDYAWYSSTRSRDALSIRIYTREIINWRSNRDSEPRPSPQKERIGCTSLSWHTRSVWTTSSGMW